LVAFGKALAKELDLDLKLDQMWCVFDVDDWNNAELRTAYDRAGQIIRISMSNPCFELWYLLHLISSTARLSTASLSQREALKRLEEQIPGYKKNKPITSTIVESTQQDTSRNAEALRAYHQNNETDELSREANPCTHVDKLVKQFRLP
jgi:hypothetical protein